MGDWASLLYLKRGDFKNPEKISFDVVQALDLVTGMIGIRPLILSDWRPYDPGNPATQHHISDDLSRALDVTFPGADSLKVWDKLVGSRLFTGLGVYQNENNVQSFHVDRRLDRGVDNPATWGGVITHPYDEMSGAPVRKTEYVGAALVLDMVKKNSLPVLGFLAALSFWYVWTHSRN